jgi:hypothetical protein
VCVCVCCARVSVAAAAQRVLPGTAGVSVRFLLPPHQHTRRTHQEPLRQEPGAEGFCALGLVVAVVLRQLCVVSAATSSVRVCVWWGGGGRAEG